jgi:hypothetical protein
MLIWATRFRTWSYVPFLVFLALHAYLGWGRWAFILSVAMLALRSGAARRILEAVRPAMDAGAPPQMVPEVAPEPVPLTVMRGRGRQP